MRQEIKVGSQVRWKPEALADHGQRARKNDGVGEVTSMKDWSGQWSATVVFSNRLAVAWLSEIELADQ